MAVKKLSFNFDYLYEIKGEIGPETKTVWFVFHGYGQLAKYFIKKFDPLFDDATCIIAPQGLSRFYLSGFSGRTGANWMTTEGRRQDIKNYLTYLDAIYQREIVPREHQLNINILGFSQGAYTASRWIVHRDIPYDRFVLWGGFLAHEIDRDKVQEYFSGNNIYLIYGDDDPFVGEEVSKNIERKIKKLGLHPHVMTFKGKHEIDATALRRLRDH